MHKKSLGLNSSTKNRPAKKNLGQNFLTSSNIAKDIVRFGKLANTDTVLEIGPGTGMMTEFLLETGARVIAVEKDSELFTDLQEKFAKEIKYKQLTLLNADILNFDPKSYKLKAISYKLIANIPYNITGLIFKKFLTDDAQPQSMTVMIQKEVGERILAKDGKESVLSLSIKAYGKPHIVKNVSKRHFLPQPKVDSVVLHISDISRKNFSKIDEKVFFRAIKSGFAHKRKKLMKNLESAFNKKSIKKAFNALNLDPSTRAEDLSLDKWLILTKNLQNRQK